MKKLWPYLVFIAVILLFLGKGLRSDVVFFGADEMSSDFLSVYGGHEYLATEFYKKGFIPSWNRYVGSGITSEPQLATYTPMVIFYRFLDPSLAFNLIVILNFLLVGIGILLYGQKIGLGKLPSLLSALVFTLSGFMVGHLRHVFLESALISLPYLLIVVEEIITKKRFIWGVLLAFLTYLSVCYGHLPTTFFIFFFLVIYFLLRLASHFKKENREDLKPIIVFVSGIILGILLSAIILLPALKQIQGTSRASLDMENSLVPPFRLKFFRLFLQPYAYGDPSRGTWDIATDSFWENIGYVGLLPLILALIGLFRPRRKEREWRKIFSLMGLFGFLLICGSWTPVYRILWNWIPGFSFTRAPGRFLLYLDFALAILAGLGLSRVLIKLKGLKGQLLSLLILVITIIDLFLFGYHFNNVISTSYFSQVPATVEFLKQDTGLYRIRALNSAYSWYVAWREASGWSGDLSPYFQQRELIPEDNNIIYRLETPAILYGLSGRFVNLRPSQLDSAILTEMEINKTAQLLGMENVKYLLSFDPLGEDKDFSLVKEVAVGNNKTVYIYQNQKWLPRAYLVAEARYIPDQKAVLETIINGSFDPTQEVIVEQAVNKTIRGGKGTVEIVSYEDTKIELKVKALTDGFLVMSDSNYPGWKASVDGQEQKILQANYNYRALEIEPGEHQVIFSYEPQAVKWGSLISGVTLLGIVVFISFRLVVFGHRFLGKHQKKHPEEP